MYFMTCTVPFRICHINSGRLKYSIYISAWTNSPSLRHGFRLGRRNQQHFNTSWSEKSGKRFGEYFISHYLFLRLIIEYLPNHDGIDTITLRYSINLWRSPPINQRWSSGICFSKCSDSVSTSRFTGQVCKNTSPA